MRTMPSKTIVNEVRSTMLREMITGHEIIIHPLRFEKFHDFLRSLVMSGLENSGDFMAPS
jgi:hypothetical protein